MTMPSHGQTQSLWPLGPRGRRVTWSDFLPHNSFSFLPHASRLVPCRGDKKSTSTSSLTAVVTILDLKSPTIVTSASA